MFLVHPTRLSKIFAEGRTHPCGNARHRQASKLAGRTHAKSRMRSPKMKTFEKEPNQEGRIPLRRWPARSFVTIPYTRIIAFIPHCPARKQAHTSSALRPSKSATPLEYQNHYTQASPVCNYFCARQRSFVGLPVCSFIISSLRWLASLATIDKKRRWGTRRRGGTQTRRSSRGTACVSTALWRDSESRADREVRPPFSVA